MVARQFEDAKKKFWETIERMHVKINLGSRALEKAMVKGAISALIMYKNVG